MTKAARKAMEAALARGVKEMARRHAEERWRTRGIDDETMSVSFNALSLDVEMARAHGWSEQGIRRAYDALQMLNSKEVGLAQRRHPERWRYDPGAEMDIFVGDMAPADLRRLTKEWKLRPIKRGRR